MEPLAPFSRFVRGGLPFPLLLFGLLWLSLQFTLLRFTFQLSSLLPPRSLGATCLGLLEQNGTNLRLYLPVRDPWRSSTKAYVSDLSLYGKTYSTHVLDLSLYGKTYSTHAFGWGCRNIPAREDL